MNTPQSTTELLQRARALAGKTLGALAEEYRYILPTTLLKKKAA